jgi:lantibiotic modifying enzyme
VKARAFGIVLAIAFAALIGALRARADAPPNDQAVAVDAAKWIRASRVETSFGITWPADPRDPRTVSTALYSGSPGVILFLLELYQATGDRAYLDDAKRGADELLTKINTQEGMGLYDGVAGIGFALGETFRATAEERYRRGVLNTVKILSAHAGAVRKGVQWNTTTDIISGGAGIGLYLLYVDDLLHDTDSRALAIHGGDRLLDLAIPEKGGSKWALQPSAPRLMPNFSHGTAGVAYFLATLYTRTREQRFLDGALSGAKYLLAIAKTDGDICLVPHDLPDNPDLYYLGWSHGPAGTARLFYQLSNATGDDTWMTWVKRSANGILTTGIPEKRTPGFWNNVSQDSGSAGVAQFFLDLYGVTKDPAYLGFARKVTNDLLARATHDDFGTRWVQAEDRERPDHLVAQTGFMQGAAGIGMWLLRLDGAQRGRAPFVRFPDSPWPPAAPKQEP